MQESKQKGRVFSIQAELKCTQLCTNVKCENMITDEQPHYIEDINAVDDLEDSDMEEDTENAEQI